jgi:Chaperone of endosialidase
MKKHPKENATKPTTILTISAALAGLALSLAPNAFGVVPAPDGGYPGGNTAEGQAALFSLTSGTYNTAVGLFSLRSNTEGNFNTGVGAGALFANTADNNTATGAGALLSNTIGIFSTANGAFALFSNTEGHHNTAVGARALLSNTTGEENTALGFGALGDNADGNQNAATGSLALSNNTTGSHNTANGDLALRVNSTGNNNVALGFFAGANVTTANNVICIGAYVYGFNVDDSCFIGSIRGAPVGVDATPVIIDSTGKLGTMASSRRFKTQIKPMNKTSEAVLALKPVTFSYKSDKTNTPQCGLIAEEVEQVNPDLVVRDKEGKTYSVRYDQVNAMLLNEFLKEHHKVEQQQATITQLKSTVAQQQKDFQATAAHQQKEIQALGASLKEQASQIQNVSARLEAKNPAPQMASLSAVARALPDQGENNH